MSQDRCAPSPLFQDRLPFRIFQPSPGSIREQKVGLSALLVLSPGGCRGDSESVGTRVGGRGGKGLSADALGFTTVGVRRQNHARRGQKGRDRPLDASPAWSAWRYCRCCHLAWLTLCWGILCVLSFRGTVLIHSLSAYYFSVFFGGGRQLCADP